LEVLPNLYSLLDAHYKAYLLLLFSWFVISDYTNQYSWNTFKNIGTILKRILYQVILFTIILFAISGIKSEDLLSNILIFYYSLALFLVLLFTRLFVYFQLINNHKKGKGLKNVLILGNNVNSIRLKKVLLNKNNHGLKLIEDRISERFDELKELIENNNIKEIFLSQSGNFNYEKELLLYCEDKHIKVNYIPYSLNNDLISLEVDYIDTIPYFKIKKYPLDKAGNRTLKLLFDILFSLSVCVFLLSWLVPIIALLIRLDSKGPIFFIQERRGLNGDIFNCFKFRTMRTDGTNSIKSTIVNDSRITRIGNFLRRTSIDELPQFFNVLKGDMSIVGPRPHMVLQDDHYGEIINKYNLRHCVKPGITGYAQVKGFRGPINSDKDMEDRIITDIYYVRNWSLLFDIQIIYQTIVLVFKGDENAI